MIYFLHIPKTGGQTLATRIAAAFPEGRAYILKDNIANAEALKALLSTYDYVEGHAGAGVLDSPPPELSVMVAVRDPVEQIISHYRHIRREPKLKLHVASHMLPTGEFMERFAAQMFNFQARSLIAACRPSALWERLEGDEVWMPRRLDDAIGRIRWLVPTEAIDEFCPLWSFETGVAVPPSEKRINVSGPDGVETDELRDWLRRRPERYVVDSLLWARARRAFENWRSGLLSQGAAGLEAASAMRVFADGDTGVWLLRDWHLQPVEGEGSPGWWAGPGNYPEIRVRRGQRRQLTFQMSSLLGVHWQRMRVVHCGIQRELPTRREIDEATGIVTITANLGPIGPDERLKLLAPEDLSALPMTPTVLEGPRRAFLARNWQLI